MRTKITRTIATSEIHAHMLEMVENVPTVKELEPITVCGQVTNEKALKILQKQYGKNSAITISRIIEDCDTYEISIDEFLKHAIKVKDEDVETEENQG